MTATDDELEASRAAFEAKVRSRRAVAPAPGGKGSPPALLTIGLVGTAVLALCAGWLGGGLLYVPALVPLVTVLLVLLVRRTTSRPSPGRR